MPSNFGTYKGDKFLALDIPPREWLVEKLCRRNDSVILVGNEKSGKSLFIFQLICSLTSCHPFLDRYAVLKPCKVVYVQLEGELGNSQDRFKRMIKTVDLHPELFTYMFYPPLEMEDKSYTDGLAMVILKNLNPEAKHYKEMVIKPDVVIIDPIYFAFRGSLSNDELVRKFIGNLRIFKDKLECAIILVHHTHKTRWDIKGNKINEGDEALFGSKFFKAWADHILLFLYDPYTLTRILMCNTQRSGDIMRECYLKLIEPDPLYFVEERMDDRAPNKDYSIVELLKTSEYLQGLSAGQIIEYLNISKPTFYKSIKQPLAQGIIIKLDGERPIKYCIPKRKEDNVL